MNSPSQRIQVHVIATLFALLIVQPVAQAADDKLIDLLREHDVGVDHSTSLVLNRSRFASLSDGDPRTVLVAEASREAAFEVVLGFGGKTITIEQLNVQVAAVQRSKIGPIDVEILASILSPHAGFHVLRSDRLKPTNKLQKFSFPATAARWILVRLKPADVAESVAISEIGIMGHRGVPKTHYAFKESPAKALKVLAHLKQSVDVVVSKDMADLFDDAEDGKLDRWSFADAALLVSGVEDRRKRRQYLKQLDGFDEQARQATLSAKSSYEKGDLLLKWLHKEVMAKGYVANQTDVSTILTTGTFNCVSSAALYNVFARRLGLNVRTIEVPDHAFSILYDGTKHADIETTTPLGFNPARDPVVQSQFEKKTGFRYLPDRHRDQRREVGETGLLAIIYYNHGVRLTEEKKFDDALVTYFHALSLDPEFDSAIKNVLAVLANWSSALSKAGKYENALDVLHTGLELAPKDALLNNNLKAVWHEWAEAAINDSRHDEAVAILKKAAADVPKSHFDKMQAWVFIRLAEELIKQKKWQAALSTAASGLGKVGTDANEELKSWRINAFLRWSVAEINEKDFESAATAIESGLKVAPKDKRLINNLVFAAQEWSWSIYQQDGSIAAEKILDNLTKRHANIPEMQNAAASYVSRLVKQLNARKKFEEAIAAVSRNKNRIQNKTDVDNMLHVVYDTWANQFANKGDWQQAVAVYADSLKSFPADKHLTNNLMVTWDLWASRMMQNKDWAAAAKVYQLAIQNHPENKRFKNNLTYVGKEWSWNEYKKKGAAEAEKLLRQLTKANPKVAEVTAIVDIYLQRVVQEHTKAGKYSEALAAIDRCQRIPHDKNKSLKLVRSTYDQWSHSLQKTKEWQPAVDVYVKSLKRLPKDKHLTRNAIVTWNAWAKLSIDAKDWDTAIEVYTKANAQFPDNSLLKNNLKFCRQKKKQQN